VTHLFKLVAASTIILSTFSVVSASELENRLDRELKGASGILEVDVFSGCSGTYSDNEVGSSGVASKAPHRFTPGEVAKIDKIKVKRQRVDLLVTLVEPILQSRTDGPFELFDERICKAQLIFMVPREVIKGGNAEAVLEIVRRAFTVFPSPEAARESENWSGRECDQLPDDYQTTLVRYEVWKAEQLNIAIAARRAEALDEATDIVDDILREEDYLDGFAAGVEKMRSVRLSDCGTLVDAHVSSYDRSPPSDQKERWKEGYRDGQRLIFNLMLARRLERCQIPIPQLP
jgi:hypothetical protein